MNSFTNHPRYKNIQTKFSEIKEKYSAYDKNFPDYKPFSDLYTPMSIVNILLRSALIPVNLAMLEYNQHNENVDKLIKKGTPAHLIPDFDYNAWQVKHTQSFFKELRKISFVVFAKKSLETLCIKYCPMELGQKLTKDLQKSIFRKVQRYGQYSSITMQKVFYTSISSQFLYFTSLYIYEFLSIISNDCIQFYDNWNKSDFMKALAKFPFGPVCWASVKKMVMIATNLYSTSLGYSLGTYLHPTYGGVTLGCLCDLVGSTIMSLILP